MHAFVMIPYQPLFDKVFNDAIKPAIEAAELDAEVVREEHYIGSIFERILVLIKEARLCVADVTGGNPNVMAEVGYSQGIGPPIVFIAQGTAETTPFNIRHKRC